MFQELDALRGFLAPTKYVAALWAVGFLVFVAGWCLWSSRRLTRLSGRIRTRDPALWEQLGSPRKWDEIGTAGNWPTLRRLRVDSSFARKFDQRLVGEIHALQRRVATGLLIMAVAGVFVMFLVWPHR